MRTTNDATNEWRSAFLLGAFLDFLNLNDDDDAINARSNLVMQSGLRNQRRSILLV